MEYALYACRFVQFASAMVVFGSTAFRFYALRGEAAAVGFAAFDDGLQRVTLAAAILALVSALSLLLCQSAIMASAPAAAFDPATVGAVLFETRFGRVWFCHLLFAAILVAACFGEPTGRQKVVLILSLLLLASLAWTGHAAIGEGAAGVAREFNQTMHLLAAGLWLGGLVPLGWLLRQGPSGRDAAGFILTRDAVRRGAGQPRWLGPANCRRFWGGGRALPQRHRGARAGVMHPRCCQRSRNLAAGHCYREPLTDAEPILSQLTAR
jgi:putative copper export protein